jgi:HPt (histidine-containing phosphotransfer) domain-containing protein
MEKCYGRMLFLQNALILEGMKQPIINELELRERLQGDQDLLSQVAQLFVADAIERLGQLQEAVALGDLAQVARLAHSIKGTAANVAAGRLLVIAEQLEILAQAGKLAEIKLILSGMERELNLVSKEILKIAQVGES